MSDVKPVAGFIWGTVVQNADPLGIGRVKVRVEGLWETENSDWVLPIGWPGAGGKGNQGSKYTVPLEAQVALIFEQGDITAPPVYLPGPYGAPGGKPAGTELIAQMHADDAEDELNYQVIWEDDYFQFFFVTNGVDDRRMVMYEKNTGSHVIMNATDGSSKKSCTISIKASTSIDIQSAGAIRLDAKGQVQIQGRVVQRKPGVTTI